MKTAELKEMAVADLVERIEAEQAKLFLSAFKV